MSENGPRAVGSVIQLAGGKLVGRTRLQKSVCLLELAGVGYGFSFSYRHFGPYSEDLFIASGDADALGLITEEKLAASWGGWYSAYSSKQKIASDERQKTSDDVRKQLLEITASANAVELELAVTAVFLAVNKVPSPWDEVATRKSAKSSAERMTGAQALYTQLRAIKTPIPLPAI